MKNFLYDLFTKIKNGQLTKCSFIYHLNKKSCKLFLNILWNNGLIIGYKTLSIYLKIFLRYNRNYPVINSFKFLHKSNCKTFYSASKIWRININKSFIIFSTNKGLQTIFDCRKQKIGGKPFIKIN